MGVHYSYMRQQPKAQKQLFQADIKETEKHMKQADVNISMVNVNSRVGVVSYEVDTKNDRDTRFVIPNKCFSFLKRHPSVSGIFPITEMR